MQYAVCGKCLHLMENHTTKIESEVITEVTSCKEKGCTCSGYGRVPHSIITIEGLKKSYNTTEHIEFSLHIKGYTAGSTIVTKIFLRRVYKDTDRQLPPLLQSTPIEESIWVQSFVNPVEYDSSLRYYEITIKVPSKNDQLLHARESGLHSLVIESDHNALRRTFEVK